MTNALTVPAALPLGSTLGGTRRALTFVTLSRFVSRATSGSGTSHTWSVWGCEQSHTLTMGASDASPQGTRWFNGEAEFCASVGWSANESAPKPAPMSAASKASVTRYWVEQSAHETIPPVEWN